MCSLSQLCALRDEKATKDTTVTQRTQRKNMKKFICNICLLFIAINLSAQNDSVYLFSYFKGNGDGLHYAYSEDGYKWQAMFNDSIVLRPTVSKDKLFRDPCIVLGADGLYHMVWTVSWNDRGIGYASSPDLIHWSAQRFLPVMAHEDSARNTWAPEITYDAANKNYMIYWATTITGRFPNKDTAAESGYNHRMYSVTTKNFTTFSKAKLLYEPGFSVIDASVVRDGNRWVMFLKNETRSPVEKNIRMATAKNLTGPYTAPGAPITGEYWAEGPTALKLNGQWIVYFDKYTNKKYGAVVSSDLERWADVSDKVEFPKGTRHGTAFAVSKAAFEQMKAEWKKGH